jgi:succinate dehydrogenase / fumarate reductase membrane anchor subunit
MASTRVTEPRSANITNYGATARPAGGTGWETFSWWFFRVSGVALIFLAIIHLLIMHVSNDVSATNYDFVAARYANPFWRLYDLLLLTLALFHGLNGLRIIIDDYIKSRGVRLAVVSTLFFTALFFWLLGTITIITFHPGQTVTQVFLSLLAR